jgi:hypothetical protein
MLDYVVVLDIGAPLVKPAFVNNVEFIIENVPLSVIHKVEVLSDFH